MANNNSMNKVISESIIILNQPEYGVPPTEKTDNGDIIMGIIKNLIIPLIFIIGMIVYLRKGKSKLIKIILISAFIIMLMMFISLLF